MLAGFVAGWFWECAGTEVRQMDMASAIRLVLLVLVTFVLPEVLRDAVINDRWERVQLGISLWVPILKAFARVVSSHFAKDRG